VSCPVARLLELGCLPASPGHVRFTKATDRDRPVCLDLGLLEHVYELYHHDGAKRSAEKVSNMKLHV
jgi:hypothetical protein